jgi:hypothetical protein
MKRAEVAAEAVKDINDEDRELLPLLVMLLGDARDLQRRVEVAREKARLLATKCHLAEHRAVSAETRMLEAWESDRTPFATGVRAMRHLVYRNVRKLVADRELAEAIIQLVKEDAKALLLKQADEEDEET